ncbi:MAG: hypothetical protein V1711_00810 [bacterium]
MSKKKFNEEERREVIGKVPEIDLNCSGFDVVESGIRSLVQVLWNHGYVTTCSCAGHTFALEPLPWVAILANKTSSQKLIALFTKVGHFNLKQGKDGKLPKIADTWVLSPQIVGGDLVVYLRPQSCNEHWSRNELLRLRHLGEDLSKFIEDQ